MRLLPLGVTESRDGSPQPGSVVRRLSTLNNFILMCVAFSCNHGAVTSVLGISVTLLGDNGSYMDGALYVMYALTALLFATAPLDLLGSRLSLIVAAATYSIFVIAFPVSLLIPPGMPGLELAVALVGGIVGGFAAGFIWVAQGQYFANSAKLYAAEVGIEESEANQTLASIFAFTLLSVEVLLKLFPVALLPISGHTLVIYPGANHSAPTTDAGGDKTLSLSNLIIASTYSVVAVGAVVFMRLIQDVDALQQPTVCNGPGDDADALRVPLLRQRTCSLHKASAAARLWCSRPTVLLLAPIQITFGVCAALLGQEVSGTVIPEYYPQNSVIIGSLMGTLVSFTAGALQIPAKLLRARLGRVPLMLGGLLAFVALSLLILLLRPEQLGGPGALVPIYLLQGLGRSCFEGTNKALYADLFPNDAAAAFSNIVIFNGGASAAAYFVFPLLAHEPNRKSIKAVTALVPACIAVAGYLGAEFLHRKHPGKW